jgi:hypothetical protein
VLKLSRHETALVVLYRIAALDVRRRVDADLFDAWTRHPCSNDPKDSGTVRYRLAVRRLHAEHLVGSTLARFTTFWPFAERGK